MQKNLKERSSWGQLQAMDRAAQRVSTWPAWKRTAVQYRNGNPAARDGNRDSNPRELQSPHRHDEGSNS